MARLSDAFQHSIASYTGPTRKTTGLPPSPQREVGKFHILAPEMPSQSLRQKGRAVSIQLDLQKDKPPSIESICVVDRDLTLELSPTGAAIFENTGGAVTKVSISSGNLSDWPIVPEVMVQKVLLFDAAQNCSFGVLKIEISCYTDAYGRQNFLADVLPVRKSEEVAKDPSKLTLFVLVPKDSALWKAFDPSAKPPKESFFLVDFVDKTECDPGRLARLNIMRAEQIIRYYGDKFGKGNFEDNLPKRITDLDLTGFEEFMRSPDAPFRIKTKP
ncbi:hypothetical protein HY988_00805 [Candidatus Micrarchaeota archaeon]|nr:hypothetical protein [Candidatus Micrarchaeota archaeon]